MKTPGGKSEQSLLVKELVRVRKDRRRLLKQLPDEARRDQQAFVHLFHDLDTDGSGAINEKDFRPLLSSLKMKVSEVEFQLILNEIDADQSGDIQFRKIF